MKLRKLFSAKKAALFASVSAYIFTASSLIANAQVGYGGGDTPSTPSDAPQTGSIVDNIVLIGLITSVVGIVGYRLFVLYKKKKTSQA